jgi:diguanylate cyclase (GGDEF)-like protein
MSIDPDAVPAAPDRLLARATGFVIGAGLGIILAAHGTLDRAVELQWRSTELALEAASRASTGVDRVDGPPLERTATRARAAAAEAADATRTVVIGSLALHLIGGAVLVAGVLEPARRRVRAWVAQTAREDHEHRLRLLHDPLTGLPNAAFLHAHLARLATGSERAERQTAVMRIDLDRFKTMREALGQRTCDEILRIAARRIQQGMRAGDFAAFLGQDDFAVIAGDLDDPNDAAMIAGRIQAALSKPFSIRGGARRITCGIGVTLLSDDEPDPDRALTNAEIALDEAQAAGPGNVSYFRESMRREVERRETLFAELLNALENAELVPFFQPQIGLATGAFCGFEALVRWQHPRHGLLAPGAFLELADQTDLTERLGEVVLTRSLEALRAWDAAGLAVPRVGINFALAQLGDPRLIEKIKWETERFDVEPGRIAIEVLETVLIKSDTDMVVRNLRGLASAGFHVELDDFGTGHASISNLRRFLVDRIKIDRSFINGIETSEEQQKLTASMIAMAHALGIGTLAEGVETEAAADVLRRLGCDQFQGYLVARPMSLADSLAWLADFRGHPPLPEARVRPAGADPNTP